LSGRLILGLALACVQIALAQPDVFLVTIDTLRADHIHCFGDAQIQTPALDSLARDGVRFSRVFTPSPITTPSHVSILTGLLSSTHGVTSFGARLSPVYPTCARLLKDRGYQTAAFIGSVVLDSKSLAPGLDEGFDLYDNFPEHAASSGSRWGRLERRAMEVVQHAESWMAAHPAHRRFVWIHLYDPHDPYEPPAPFSETYKTRLYDGEIAYADSALQHLLAFLKARSLYANALIVVTGDHGEGLGEHGEDTHGIFLYDSTTHVPLIVKLPGGGDAGAVVDALARTTDILPTVLEIANVRTSAKFDGESLVPLIRRASAAPRLALGETDYPLEFGWAQLRSVRTDNFKFIEAPRPELYDLRADPGEGRNVYEPWNRWVQEARAKLATLRTAPANALPPETLAELRALGYLGNRDALSATNAPEPSLLADPKDKIQEHNLLHRAMMASESGKPEQAREALSALLKLNPSSVLAFRQLGELDIAEGRYADAVSHFDRVRASLPRDPALAYELGMALEKMDNPPAAREALEASLKLLPGQFDARLLLGEVYFRLNDNNAAADQFEASLLLRPSSNEAKLWLARTHVASGKISEALKEVTDLVKRDPRNPEVFRSLADIYRALGKNAEAHTAEETYKSFKAGK